MKHDIGIFTLTSELHNAEAIAAATKDFLGSLNIDYDFLDDDYTEYGERPLNLFYVRTGGTEGILKRLLPHLRQQSQTPLYLLTSGKSNSLAASMEILSYLKQQGLEGEIVHGNPEFIARRIVKLCTVAKARAALKGTHFAAIGEPSDWLIASQANEPQIRKRLGMELLQIPMQELLDKIAQTPLDNNHEPHPNPDIAQALPGAWQIYRALKGIVDRHNLKGFTLRCFDLLTSVHNTGCLALAKLNSEGIVAGCEGDVPSMLSMAIVKALTGLTGFQSNPARIDIETGEMIFAHCTIPFNLIERYELLTHYESGIGVGIRGFMSPGPVTIFKVSGDLQRYFIAEGTLTENLQQPDLCRTQQLIRLDEASQAEYFLSNPIGNHHIIVPGHHRELLELFMQ